MIDSWLAYCITYFLGNWGNSRQSLKECDDLILIDDLQSNLDYMQENFWTNNNNFTLFGGVIHADYLVIIKHCLSVSVLVLLDKIMN